jgi:hypothetical protein
LQDEKLKKQINPIIIKKKPTKNDLQFIANIVLNSEMVNELKSEMAELGLKELGANSMLAENKRGKDAAILLRALATEM